jgi:O-antigen ligase
MDKSYMIRETMNQRSWKLFLQSPIWGIGPGRYRQVYVPLEMPQVMANRSDTDFVRKSAHNSYLSFLAEGGLLATLPLAALLCFLAIRGGWAAIVLARRGAHWALGVYASFIAMSVHLWSLSGLTGTHAWFIYGLLAATLGVFRHIAKKTMDAPKSQHVIKPPAGLAPWHPSNGAYSLIFGRVHNFETARWSSSNQPLNKKSTWGYRKSSETWKSPLCTWVRR